ncbi:hypothetical protein P7245_22495 [Vibrio parahaemolyticus]|nr:hypothetical protein [Vibrio parahaemolyticus]
MSELVIIELEDLESVKIEPCRDKVAAIIEIKRGVNLDLAHRVIEKATYPRCTPNEALIEWESMAMLTVRHDSLRGAEMAITEIVETLKQIAHGAFVDYREAEQMAKNALNKIGIAFNGNGKLSD